MATTVTEQAKDPNGRDATSPAQLPMLAWKEILGRVWVKTGTDNIGLLAAGVAFFAFLAFVPLLGAMVMTYGLVADPKTIADHMHIVISLVPKDAAKLILDQILSLVTTASSKKGLGLAVALLVSLYGASRASGAVMSALNVVYEQPERRGFIETAIIALIMIVGSVAIMVLGLLAASALTFVGHAVDSLGPLAGIAVTIATWLVAGALASTGIGAAYRWGPSRHDAKWRWLSVGSVLATVLWLLATVGFGAYATTLGAYNATYGSLSAVVVLLMWLWVSAYAILLGAELNAEAERQTARDTTTGTEKPLGRRGATVADQVAGEPGTEPSEEKSQEVLRRAG